MTIGFLSNAAPLLHAIPRVPANEPMTDFETYYPLTTAKIATRSFYRGKVYGVVETGQSEDSIAAFSEHLADAINGAGNYAALGASLASMGVSYETEVPESRTAEEYLGDILALLL